MDLSSYVNLALITIDIGLPHIRDVCRNSHPMKCFQQQTVKLSAFSEITDLTSIFALSFCRHPPPSSISCRTPVECVVGLHCHEYLPSHITYTFIIRKLVEILLIQGKVL
jgi:hypothetical protein